MYADSYMQLADIDYAGDRELTKPGKPGGVVSINEIPIVVVSKPKPIMCRGSKTDQNKNKQVTILGSLGMPIICPT